MDGKTFNRYIVVALFLWVVNIFGCTFTHGNLFLRDYAARRNINIGAAIMADYLEETEYTDIVVREFNLVVPENHLKWSYVHPEKDKYDFSAADKIIRFAQKNNLKVRGHALVWHKSLPKWLTPDCNDSEPNKVSYNKKELEDILEQHIKTVVTRYKGKIKYWDVVNEAFEGNDNSGELRRTFWYNILGKDYIEKAFIWAHEADKKAKLFINDFNIGERNLKSDALYEMIRDLKREGVPIHGVGFQFHLDTNKKPDFENIEANIKRFIGLGLEIQFTEIDVAICGEMTKEQLELQSEIYQGLINIALKYPQVTAFVTWGVTDKYSWLSRYAAEVLKSETFYGSGLLFDENYRKKPAYHAIQKSLNQ